MTDAGGNVARTTSARPTSGRSRPVTVLTRWKRPGCASTANSVRDLHRAELAHPAEVVAREVDDHHVLGPVLRARARASPASAAVPLIGRVSIRRPPAAGSMRRNSSGDADTIARSRPVSAPNVHSARVRRRVAPRRARRRARPDPARACAREPAGHVHLVALARARAARARARTRPRGRRGRGSTSTRRAPATAGATGSRRPRRAPRRLEPGSTRRDRR